MPLIDEIEVLRMQRLAAINTPIQNLTENETRRRLEATYGRVYDTRELSAEFEVLGFMAPYAVVRRKSDGMMGSLEFSHAPRFYFSFSPYQA